MAIKPKTNKKYAVGGKVIKKGIKAAAEALDDYSKYTARDFIEGANIMDLVETYVPEQQLNKLLDTGLDTDSISEMFYDALDGKKNPLFKFALEWKKDYINTSKQHDLDEIMETQNYRKGGTVKPKPKPKTKPVKPVPPHEQMEKLVAKGKLPKDFIEKYTQAEIGKKSGKLKELNQTFMAAGGKVKPKYAVGGKVVTKVAKVAKPVFDNMIQEINSKLKNPNLAKYENADMSEEFRKVWQGVLDDDPDMAMDFIMGYADRADYKKMIPDDFGDWGKAKDAVYPILEAMNNPKTRKYGPYRRTAQRIIDDLATHGNFENMLKEQGFID